MISKKMLDHGYWKSQLFYWQSIIYYLFYSLKFRSITWFTAANPAIHMGGMLDENKDKIFELIPTKYLPITYLIKFGQNDLDKIISGLTFPLIIKPNLGLKGWNVTKVFEEGAVFGLLEKYKDLEWILQEFIATEAEYSVLCHRKDHNEKIQISSITEKRYPFVIGDGLRSIEQLSLAKNDPFLDLKSLATIHGKNWHVIPAKDENIFLHNIGNYSRGSKFFNANNLINANLIHAFDNVMESIKDVNFCRFDIKTSSIEQMELGNFKILEMNGAKSEPLHIYDPNYGWLTSIKDIHQHWITMASISAKRIHQKPFVLPNSREGLIALSNVLAATKK